MSKKTIFSIILVLIGVIGGVMVIFGYAMSGGKTGITMVFLMAAIVCIMAGSIMGFSRLLDRQVNPLVEELHKDIEDDIQDIKARRFTNTLWMIIIIGIALLVFSFFVFRFHKMEAFWGPIPVVLPTMIGLGLLAWFIPKTRWFRSQAYTQCGYFLFQLSVSS